MKRLLYIAIFIILLLVPLPAVTAEKAVSHDDGAGESAEHSEAVNNDMALASDKSAGLLDAIKKRSRELDAREEALLLEEERLNVIKSDVEEKIEDLVKSTAALEAILKSMKEVNVENVLKLAKVYENMPPEEAALRLENLDKELAVKLLKVISSRKAGKILGMVAPALAAELSEDFGRTIIPQENL